MAPALLLLARPISLALFAAGGLLWLFCAFSAFYMLALAISALFGRREARIDETEKRLLCILVPAHNEELLLGPVLEKLNGLSYPRDRYAVTVIADNCEDATADVARSRGVEVLERVNPELRGKGYALVWALEKLLADPRCFDAFLILDADSVLSEDYLDVMNRALARGHEAIQGRYDVLNTDEGWRTRLMACALALAHYVKPLGRKALGLSDGLKGNGMCFTREVLQRVAWTGDSITEDIDYTIRLVCAGVKIDFAPEAVVRAQMPTTGSQAASQRQRWEGGRYALTRRALGLLGQGIASGRPVLIDRALELIIPPFVELCVLGTLGLLASALWLALSGGDELARIMTGMWAAALIAVVLYLALGLAIARVPLRIAVSLLFAPVYVVWKLGLYAVMLCKRGAGGWVRTERREITD